MNNKAVMRLFHHKEWGDVTCKNGSYVGHWLLGMMIICTLSVHSTAEETKKSTEECAEPSCTSLRQAVKKTPVPDAKDRRSEVKPVAVVDNGELKLFSLSTYKPNYLLPISYNRRTNDLGLDTLDENVNHVEMQFQFSLKLLLANAAGGRFPLYIAYSNRSFWQAYNKELSSPFRDTNHSPEIFMQFPLGLEWGDWKQSYITAGFVHQSNGRSIPLSRSWNRIYVEWVTELDDWTFSLKPWYRLPEKKKKEPMDPKGDDNPDIDQYMGNFEFRTDWRYQQHTVSVMVRNNLRSDNRGAMDMRWAYPLSDNIDWYVKYFYGYGETLLDYNYLNNTIGIGFAISNW